MPDIVCPECGQVSRFVAIRRAAEEFCSHCDYPLFWAPTAVAMASPGVSSETTMRRLPGAGGRQRIGTRVCHECGELNALSASYCIRCGTDLDPKPEPPPPPPPPLPPPEPEPEPEPVVEQRTPWWWWAILATLVVALIVVLVVILV
jgi:ribosomal protein L40E